MNADTSVLIPAYRAEPFIDRALQCARSQTYDRLRIVVPVNDGEDATAEKARAHTALDLRVEVIEHRERLGWAGHVNVLLSSVQTPFAFLYFHDDLLRPEYVVVMVEALRRSPDAVSAHCHMGHFGGRDDVSVVTPTKGMRSRTF